MSPVEDRRYTESRRRDWIEDARRSGEQATRWEYYKPALILAGAFLASIVIIVADVDGVGLLATLAGALLVTGLFLAIAVPIGVVAMLITCQLFGDDAGPLPLALLRLGAIYAVTFAISLIVPGCFSILVGGVVMASMVAFLFDMDLTEGAVFAIASWLIFIGVAIGLAAAGLGR